MAETLRFSYNGMACKATITNENATGWYVGSLGKYQIYQLENNGIFDPESFVATTANNYTDAWQTASYIWRQVDKTDDYRIQELLEYLDGKVTAGELTDGDADMIFTDMTKNL